MLGTNQPQQIVETWPQGTQTQTLPFVIACNPTLNRMDRVLSGNLYYYYFFLVYDCGCPGVDRGLMCCHRSRCGRLHFATDRQSDEWADDFIIVAVWMV